MVDFIYSILIKYKIDLLYCVWYLNVLIPFVVDLSFNYFLDTVLFIVCRGSSVNPPRVFLEQYLACFVLGFVKSWVERAEMIVRLRFVVTTFILRQSPKKSMYSGRENRFKFPFLVISVLPISGTNSLEISMLLYWTFPFHCGLNYYLMIYIDKPYASHNKVFALFSWRYSSWCPDSVWVTVHLI